MPKLAYRPRGPRPAPTRQPGWEEGDIAFLRESREFSQNDYRELIVAGRVHRRGTGHPCIILKRLSPTHVVVTNVSALGSGPHNDYPPPWKQKGHRRERAEDFRHFDGSEASGNKYDALHLRDGRSMPKPKTSWSNIQRVWKVPITVLKRFDKVEGVLRLSEESLDDLRKHIFLVSKGYDAEWDFHEKKPNVRGYEAHPTQRTNHSSHPKVIVTDTARNQPATELEETLPLTLSSLTLTNSFESSPLIPPPTSPSASLPTLPSLSTPTTRSWSSVVVGKLKAPTPLAPPKPLGRKPKALRRHPS